MAETAQIRPKNDPVTTKSASSKNSKTQGYDPYHGCITNIQNIYASKLVNPILQKREYNHHASQTSFDPTFQAKTAYRSFYLEKLLKSRYPYDIVA